MLCNESYLIAMDIMVLCKYFF